MSEGKVPNVPLTTSPGAIEEIGLSVNRKDGGKLEEEFSLSFNSKNDAELEVVLNSTTTPNDEDSFVYPLKTKQFELNNFFNSEFLEHPTSLDADLKDLIERKIIKDNSDQTADLKVVQLAKKFIPQKHYSFQLKERELMAAMSTKMYMRFRAYQIDQIKKAAEMQANKANEELNDIMKILNLKLSNDPNNPNNIIDDTSWSEIIKKNIQSLTLKDGAYKDQLINLQGRIKYLNKLIELYKGITLEESAKDNEYTIFHTDQANKKIGLVDITINQKNNTLTASTPNGLSEEMQKKAALTQLDFITRNRERTFDLGLKISGYNNNPGMALRIYHLAILQGSRPRIADETLAAWKKNITDLEAEKIKDPNSAKLYDQKINKFKSSLEFHEKYEGKLSLLDTAISKSLNDIRGGLAELSSFRKAIAGERKNIQQDFQNMVEQWTQIQTTAQSAETSPPAPGAQQPTSTPGQSASTSQPPSPVSGSTQPQPSAQSAEPPLSGNKKSQPFKP